MAPELAGPMVIDPGVVCYQGLKSWKYRTTQDSLVTLPFAPPQDIRIDYGGKPMLTFTKQPDGRGRMFTAASYCWDGASGPTIDTPDTQRASLYHDNGYQMIRKGLLGIEYKDLFDRVLEATMVTDGMRIAEMLEKQAEKAGFFDKLGLKTKAAWIRNTIKGRAYAWYVAVSKFGGSACKPGSDPTFKEEIAPAT